MRKSIISQRRLSVLMTEGSSMSARQALYNLGPYHKIDIMDPSPLCLSRFSRYVHRWHACPRLSDNPIEYMRSILHRLSITNYDIVFPTHEETYLLSRFQESIGNKSKVVVPAFSAMEKLQSKLAFRQVLQECDLPQPSSVVITPSQVTKIKNFPCFLKQEYGTAGAGVAYIKSGNELERVVADWQALGLISGNTNLLIQQSGRGQQSVVQLVFNRGNLVAGHCSEGEAAGVGGAPTIHQSSHHDNVMNHMQQLGRYLQWHGAFFVEYFYDHATGKPEYIEANPRIGETSNALHSGTDLCHAVLAVAFARSINLKFSQTEVLSRNSLTLLVSVAGKTNSRLQILKELWRLLQRKPLQLVHEEVFRFKVDPWTIVPAVAIIGLLLAYPRLEQLFIRKTVERYQLTASATRIIQKTRNFQGRLNSNL